MAEQNMSVKPTSTALTSTPTLESSGTTTQAVAPTPKPAPATTQPSASTSTTQTSTPTQNMSVAPKMSVPTSSSLNVVYDRSAGQQAANEIRSQAAATPPPASSTVSPSSPTLVAGVPLKTGLSSAQVSSIQTLASKPVSSWTTTDKQNWAYATNNGALPSTPPPSGTTTSLVPPSSTVPSPTTSQTGTIPPVQPVTTQPTQPKPQTTQQPTQTQQTPQDKTISEAEEALQGLKTMQEEIIKRAKIAGEITPEDEEAIRAAGRAEAAKWETKIQAAQEEKKQQMAKDLIAGGQAGGFMSTQIAGVGAFAPTVGGTFVGAGGLLARSADQYSAAVANLQAAQQQAITEAENAKRYAIMTGKEKDLEQMKASYAMAADLVDRQNKLRQEQFDRENALKQLQRLEKQDANDTFNSILGAVEDGFDIEKIPQEYMEELERATGKPPGFMREVASMASSAAEAKAIAAQEERYSKEIENASKIVGLLDKIPVGQSITVAGTSYMGMKKGDVASGTEMDQFGNVTYWEIDKNTRKTFTTNLGPIGKPQDGWTPVQTDQGFFNYNVKTNQYVPLQPTSAQTTWQAIFPDGSQSPYRSANDPYQGECAAFCNDMYQGGKILGNSFNQKQTVMKQWEVSKEDVQVGDSFLMTAGTTGHVGFISGVQDSPNGKILTILESNYVPPGGGVISTTRTMSINDPKLKMISRIPTREDRLPPAGPDSPVTRMAMGGEPTIGGKPISQVMIERTQSAKTADEKPLSGEQLKDYGLDPTQYAGYTLSDVKEYQKRAKEIGPAAMSETSLLRLPSFQEFAKNLETQLANDPSIATMSQRDVQRMYDEQKNYVKSIEDSFNAVKRGKLTKDERAEFVSQAEDAINRGDINSFEGIVNQVALKSMDQTAREKYQLSRNLSESYEVGLDLLSSFSKDPTFRTGNLKSIFERAKTKGSFDADPRYTQLNQILSTFQNEYRNAIAGASLTPMEKEEVNKAIVDPSVDTPATMWDKMQRGMKLQNFVADARISDSLGLPRPKLADYLK